MFEKSLFKTFTMQKNEVFYSGIPHYMLPNCGFVHVYYRNS